MDNNIFVVYDTCLYGKMVLWVRKQKEVNKTSEIGQAAAFFIGFGVMVFMFILSYLFWQFGRSAKSETDKEVKINLFEELCIDNLAKKKGINLENEAIKRDISFSKRKSFRKKLEEQVYEDLFGKEKE